jgi:hypothetical protein
MTLKRAWFRTFAIVSILLMLLSMPASVVLAAGGSGQGNGGQMGTGGYGGSDSSGLVPQGGKMMNQTQKDAQLQQMLGEGARLGLFGGFGQSNSNFEGRFLSVQLNKTSGSITNYTVATSGGNETVFSHISLKDFAPSNVSVTGTLLVEQDSNASIVVHDNPVALLHISSNRSMQSANFTLAPGISAALLPRGSNETNISYAWISGTGIQGILMVRNGTLEAKGDGAGSTTIVANSSDITLRMKPSMIKGYNAINEAVQTAIANGKVAGELSVIVRNGSAMFDLLQYQTGFVLEVQQASENHVQVVASSNGNEGRVAIINLDQGTFDTRTNNDIVVTIDGKTIRQTQNPLEVLGDSGSQEGDAVYCIENTLNGSQLMIYVPSFSTHVLDISSVSPLASVMSITGLLAFLGAMGTVGVATYLLFVRKRKK